MGVVIKQSIKGTIVNYFGTFLGFIITFFVMTNFLTAEEVGLRDVLVNVSTMFAGLAQIGTSSSILRYYPYFKDEQTGDHGFFVWTFLLPLVGFIIFSIVFLLLRDTVATHFAANSQLFVDYYPFVFLLGFFMLYITVFETNSNVLMRIVVPKFIREIGLRLFALISYLLYAFKVVNLNNFILIFCFGYGVAALLNIIYLFSLKRISLKPDIKFISKALTKDFTSYTLFLLLSVLTTTMIPVLNSIFISKDMGLVYTGIFAIATYITAIIEIPYRSLGAISQPTISQAIKENNLLAAETIAKKVSLHQFLAGSIIFFLVWINIDYIFSILPNGTIYSEGKYVVLILGFYKLLTSSLSIGNSILSYSRYYYYSLVFTVILSALAIFLNIKLIPLSGMQGAAVASLLSYAIYFLLLLTFIRLRLHSSPLSKAHLKVIVIMVILFLLNWAIRQTITPLILAISWKPILVNTLEALFRSDVLASIGLLLIYFWKVSPEINRILTNKD